MMCWIPLSEIFNKVDCVPSIHIEKCYKDNLKSEINSTIPVHKLQNWVWNIHISFLTFLTLSLILASFISTRKRGKKKETNKQTKNDLNDLRQIKPTL